jgi:excisionase family DNA binding protein
MSAAEEVLPLLRSLEERLAPPQWYTLGEAAKVMQASPSFVRREVLAKRLRAADIGTARRPLYRISREAIKSYMEEREASPRPARAGGGALPVSRHLSASACESLR